MEKEFNPIETILPDGGMTAILNRVGCIGDSLSAGENEWVNDEGKVKYHDFYEASWGQFMARKCGLEVVNMSNGGLTALTFHSFARYTKSFYFEKKCKAYIIALGVNDITHLDSVYEGGFGTMNDVDYENIEGPSNTFVGNYVKIILKIRQLVPDARIFCVTVPRDDRKDEEKKNLYDKHAEFIRNLPNYFKSLYVIDLRKYARDFGEDFTKTYRLGGHLSPIGYKYVADIMATYIDYIIMNNIDDFKGIMFVGTGMKARID